MTDDNEVECDRHGKTLLTFACRHVARGVACGFWIAPPEEGQGRPDATCDWCDERLNAGEEVGASELCILCTYCWDEARARNEKVPAFARGTTARLTLEEQDRLIHHAVDELQATQERAQDRWQIGLGSRATSFMRWDFSADAGTITFSSDGKPRAIADVKIVGTYAKESGTFQWGWHTVGDDNDPIVAGLSDLTGFGHVRGIERLTKVWWKCELAEGWEMTALAAYLFGCDAAYRMPGDGQYEYTLLKNMRSIS